MLLSKAKSTTQLISRYNSYFSRELMKKHEIVPQIITEPPPLTAQVYYTKGKAQLGNEIDPEIARTEPIVHWPHNPNKLYTLVMVDPDSPARSRPVEGEVHHWLVGNIPGNRVELGSPIYDYLGPIPNLYTGLHRIVVLVFEQRGKIKFAEKRLWETCVADRANKNVKKLASKYKLGSPLAGNFFFTQWDQSVDEVYRMMRMDKAADTQSY